MISAAYLWLDPERREARYSAAGHPPLLAWRRERLERIVSNGLLIGMVAGVRLSGVHAVDRSR